MSTEAQSQTSQDSSDTNAAITDPQQEQLVTGAIKEISHIATLPEVTLQIIKLVEDPDSTAGDLNKIISNDPALGARILKVVNSAFYGLPGQIGSINRAIVLLGLNAVKNIAIAASLAKLFRGGQICDGFNAKDLWTHSISVATATKLIADKTNLGLPDEAFLAGLMHDLGIMVEIQAKRSEFVDMFELYKQDDNLSWRQAEMQCIGATHEHFGAALCKQWKFPTSLSYVTGFHHHPMDLSPAHRSLACVVYLADVVSKQAQQGMVYTLEVDEPAGDVLDELKITKDQLVEVVTALPDAIADASYMAQGVA